MHVVLPNKTTSNCRKEGMAKFKSPNNFKPSYRKILFQITEYEIFDYLCKSKYFNLWMVTDIE